MSTTVSQLVVIEAEDAPVPGTAGVAPHQRYRFPRISVKSRELTELDPDHIRVRMRYVGICGTDLHLSQFNAESGYVLTSAPALIPSGGRIMGHEGVGEVVAVGVNVNGIEEGNVVSFASILACMRCGACRRGHFNQCFNSLLLGMEIDGLFGTLVDVPATLAHDVSDLVRTEADLRAMACLEPAAVALLACENAVISAGDSVLVFGGGPIGLFCAVMSKRIFGAAHVTLVEPVAKRRDLASRWCDTVYDVEAFFDQDDFMVDIVFEASGNLRNINRIFTRILENGSVVLLGRSGESLTIDAVDHMITNAVKVMGSRGHLGGVLDKLTTLHRSGVLPLDLVVTDEFGSLDQLAKSLKQPDQVTQENCKVLVKIRQ